MPQPPRQDRSSREWFCYVSKLCKMSRVGGRVGRCFLVAVRDAPRRSCSATSGLVLASARRGRKQNMNIKCNASRAELHSCFLGTMAGASLCYIAPRCFMRYPRLRALLPASAQPPPQRAGIPETPGAKRCGPQICRGRASSRWPSNMQRNTLSAWRHARPSSESASWRRLSDGAHALRKTLGHIVGRMRPHEVLRIWCRI